MALKDGRVISWGTDESYSERVPMWVPSEAQSGVTAISATTGTSMALKDGRVLVWAAADANVDDGSRWAKTLLPVPDEVLSGVTSIAAGGSGAVALKHGRVIAWGSYLLGTVVPDEARTGVTEIAAGEGHILALKKGTVYAWGSNRILFNGTWSGQSIVPAAAKSKVVGVAAGLYHSLAIVERVVTTPPPPPKGFVRNFAWRRENVATIVVTWNPPRPRTGALLAYDYRVDDEVLWRRVNEAGAYIRVQNRRGTTVKFHVRAVNESGPGPSRTFTIGGK